MSGSKPALPSRVRPNFRECHVTQDGQHVQCYRCHEYCYHCGMFGPWGTEGWRALDDPPILVSDQPAAAEEALGKTLNVEVTFFQHGNIAIAKCQCALCNAVKSALIDARKIGPQTKLVLTFVPGEAGWPYE